MTNLEMLIVHSPRRQCGRQDYYDLPAVIWTCGMCGLSVVSDLVDLEFCSNIGQPILPVFCCNWVCPMSPQTNGSRTFRLATVGSLLEPHSQVYQKR